MLSVWSKRFRLSCRLALASRRAPEFPNRIARGNLTCRQGLITLFIMRITGVEPRRACFPCRCIANTHVETKLAPWRTRASRPAEVIRLPPYRFVPVGSPPFISRLRGEKGARQALSFLAIPYLRGNAVRLRESDANAIFHFFCQVQSDKNYFSCGETREYKWT